jgi:flagellar basal-body rod protein FlgF
MENALLIGLSRQMTLRRELDTIANNVANVNTAGFKADQLLFQDHLMPTARIDGAHRGDRAVHYVIDPRTRTDFAGGAVEQTGGEYDVAIQGQGFFAVQAPGGERYTRAGAFRLDATGRLVTATGLPVLTEGGPISFTAEDGRVTIGADGTISTRQGLRGRLRVVRFADEAALRKDGENLFAPGQGQQAQAATQATRVVQGALERSNVQPVLEIARMIEVTRAYQTVSQMIDRTQDLRRTAIERLAQLP